MPSWIWSNYLKVRRASKIPKSKTFTSDFATLCLILCQCLSDLDQLTDPVLPACKKSLRNLLPHLKNTAFATNGTIRLPSLTPRRASVCSFFTRLFAQASHDISFHLPFYIFLTSYDNLFPFILCLCSNVFPGFLFLFCSPSAFLKDGHIQ